MVMDRGRRWGWYGNDDGIGIRKWLTSERGGIGMRMEVVSE